MRGLSRGRHCRQPQRGHSRGGPHRVGFAEGAKRSAGTSYARLQVGHQVRLLWRIAELIPASLGRA